MEIRQCIFTRSNCFKDNLPMTPAGILVHSTGANNPNLRRYVQPDDGLIGKNLYGNDYNRAINQCPHAFIGKDKNGDVRCYQVLPWEIACWGCGRGARGSYNYNPTGHIQFEICEDALTDRGYFEAAFDTAAGLCAFLCQKFGLGVDSIVSHKEAAQAGYASNHGDPENWLSRFGQSMNDFRARVSQKLSADEKPAQEEAALAEPPAASGSVMRIAQQPICQNVTNICPPGAYTILETTEIAGIKYGRLKSGAGWVRLE